MRIHGRAGCQQFFQDDVAFKGAAFVAAIPLGPGHSQPAARAQLATEVGVGTVPVLGALLGGIVFQRVSEKFADLGAQGVCLGIQMTGPDIECLHGCVLM
ncbi:hypothetical protein D3C72_1925100 [compost metagenome]